MGSRAGEGSLGSARNGVQTFLREDLSTPANSTYVSVNTRAHEIRHVMLHDTEFSTRFRVRALGCLMFTSEVLTDRERIVSPDTTTDGIPALFHQSLGTRKLEIVDIDGQEHLPFLMPEAAPPLIDRREPDRLKVVFTMSLPVTTRIRMSVKGRIRGQTRSLIFFQDSSQCSLGRRTHVGPPPSLECVYACSASDY